MMLDDILWELAPPLLIVAFVGYRVWIA